MFFAEQLADDLQVMGQKGAFGKLRIVGHSSFPSQPLTQVAIETNPLDGITQLTVRRIHQPAAVHTDNLFKRTLGTDNHRG